MSSVRRVLGFVVSVVLTIGVFFAVLYRQELSDQWTVRQYQPSSGIAQLADRSGLSERGRFYLYVGKAELASAQVFNSGCQRVERSNPILGCYLSGSDKIYIYDIEEPRLDGIKEVTAAHEMLHVVFARLRTSEQEWLSRTLEEIYQQHKTPELESRMEYYERTEPGARTNELHAIIGTELRDIGQELEEYYAQYFTDRHKTVALYEQYRSAFTAIEQEMTTLEEQLGIQRPQIEQAQATYEADLRQYNALVASFNRRAAAGDFTSQEAFDQERTELSAQSDVLVWQRRELEERIRVYNENVERRNRLGGQMSELSRSLDSLEEVGQ